MGCKELDIVMGRFANSNLALLSDKELLQYQKILEINDTILYRWICGRENAINPDFFSIVEKIKISVQSKYYEKSETA